MTAVITLQRDQARLDHDLIVHEREQRIEVAAVEGLTHEQVQIQVLAGHPPAPQLSGVTEPSSDAAPPTQSRAIARLTSVFTARCLKLIGYYSFL
jgi:hypothetical protein